MGQILAKIGEQDTAVRMPSGRGDNYRGYNAPDPREPKPAKPRDIFIADLHIDTLKLKPRNFR